MTTEAELGWEVLPLGSLKMILQEYPSLRDRFAMVALPSLITYALQIRPICREDQAHVAMAAYEIADDMLAQRSK